MINLGNGRPFSLKDFISLVETCVGKKARIQVRSKIQTRNLIFNFYSLNYFSSVFRHFYFSLCLLIVILSFSFLLFFFFFWSFTFMYFLAIRFTYFIHFYLFIFLLFNRFAPSSLVMWRELVPIYQKPEIY